MALIFGIASICFAQVSTDYVLGPDDQVTVHAIDVDEIPVTPFRIDSAGNIDCPLIGTTHLAGMTMGQAKAQLESKLASWVKEPKVTFTLVEPGSKPVSVLGTVNKPGIYQIRGKKSLYEVLSLAEGLRPEAGNTIRITRPVESGPLPLPNARADESGRFFVGEVNVKAVLEARRPEDNVPVQANDVIVVNRAELIYVVGAVRKPGGFVLNDKESLSTLQVLSLAEGLERTAAPDRAKILRQAVKNAGRTEVSVNLRHVLEGTERDFALQADDILFIPNSATKAAGLRTMEALIQVGTGVAIWRRP
ncbi:MAG: polysaccharide biosynthesis/export family protein [Bryobacteraceae bacterium]